MAPRWPKRPPQIGPRDSPTIAQECPKGGLRSPPNAPSIWEAGGSGRRPFGCACTAPACIFARASDGPVVVAPAPARPRAALAGRPSRGAAGRGRAEEGRHRRRAGGKRVLEETRPGDASPLSGPMGPSPGPRTAKGRLTVKKLILGEKRPGGPATASPKTSFLHAEEGTRRSGRCRQPRRLGRGTRGSRAISTKRRRPAAPGKIWQRPRGLRRWCCQGVRRYTGHLPAHIKQSFVTLVLTRLQLLEPRRGLRHLRAQGCLGEGLHRPCQLLPGLDFRDVTMRRRPVALVAAQMSASGHKTHTENKRLRQRGRFLSNPRSWPIERGEGGGGTGARRWRAEGERGPRRHGPWR